MNLRVNPWIIGAGIAAGALALIFRKDIAMSASLAIDAARVPIFTAVIPSEARPYTAVILRVASEEAVDPFLVVALGMRESRWGVAIGGPGGTGDGGHGRGIMQIDDRSNGSWLEANNWRDPYTNVKKGVQILKAKMRVLASNGAIVAGNVTYTDGKTVYLSEAAANARDVDAGQYPDPRPLEGNGLLRAAVAAYNTGELNVIRSLAVGVSPDTTTAIGPSRQRDYSADVLTRVANMTRDFAEQAA